MLICICGKSGSGKSTIAKLIPNSIHVDIDKIGHNSHGNIEVKQKLINTFGDILTDGIVDRKKLGKIVFSNKEAMKNLKNITWEYMEKEIDLIIENNQNKNIVLDYLLLPLTKYFNSSSLKILLDVPYEIRKERVIKRDNITEELFDLRERNSIDYDNYNFDIVIGKRKVKKYE